jgi:ribosome-binding factor A
MRRERSANRNSTRNYARTARLNELIREVIAEELVKLDDDRLVDVAITAVEVDSDLSRGVVWFDTLDDGRDDEILEALEETRWRVQAAIGRQTTFKRTPVLSFKVDMAIRAGERIESILRDNPLPED